MSDRFKGQLSKEPAAGLSTRRLSPSPLRYFMHFPLASSHVMPCCSQSAFVGGSSAANAGAANATRRPAMIAVLKTLADMLMSPNQSPYARDNNNLETWRFIEV
jgi:hypothetical protein